MASANNNTKFRIGLGVFCLASFFFLSSRLYPTSSSNRISPLPPALAITNPHSHETYSSHICTGNEKTDPGQDLVRCHFRNVCLSLEEEVGTDYDFNRFDKHNRMRKKSSVTLKYYRPAVARKAPLYWMSDFPLEKGASWVKIGRDSSLTPDIIYHSIPPETMWSPTKTTVLTEAFWPENVGHALGDDFFPIYRLAKSFGKFEKDLGVIFHPSCLERGAFEKGCDHHQQMSELLLERPWESVSSPLFRSGQICFENLLVGTRRLGMSHASEGVWEPFIGQIKENLNLDPNRLPRKQKIHLFYKIGRRRILNYPEIKQHLEKRFNVEVEIINPADFTLEEQVRIFQDTTIVITPCGGISFSSVFLPKGASAIFLDYWELSWNGTAQMERHIYSSVSTLSALYYPLEFEDLSYDLEMVPEDHQDLDSIEFWRSWVDVTVNLERMEEHVLSALLQTESSMGLRDSFRLHK